MDSLSLLYAHFKGDLRFLVWRRTYRDWFLSDIFNSPITLIPGWGNTDSREGKSEIKK